MRPGDRLPIRMETRQRGTPKLDDARCNTVPARLTRLGAGGNATAPYRGPAGSTGQREAGADLPGATK